MQSKDIKVGAEYVYQPNSYSTAQKATVVEVGAVKQVPVGYAGRATKDVKGFIRIKSDSPLVSETLVRPQTILMLWTEYEEQEKKRQEYKAQAAETRAANLTRQAEWAFKVNQKMLDLGEVPVSGAYSYSDNQAYLAAAGFEFTGRGEATNSAIPGRLDDVMDGKYPLRVVKVLMQAVTKNQEA